MQTRRFELRQGAKADRTSGVQRSQAWLAAGFLSGGLVCAVTAVMAARLDVAAMGWCLAAPAGAWLSTAGHCPWCYAALACLAAAAAVWPDGASATVRAGAKAPNR